MKRLFLFLFLISFSTNCFAWSWFFQPKPKPITSNSTTSSVSVTSSLQEAKILIKDLNSELNSAKQQNTNLKKNLLISNEKLKNTELRVNDLQKQVEIIRNWGIEQQKLAFEWMEKHDKLSKKYKTAKYILSILVGIFGAVIGIYCMRFVPPIYAAYAFALPVVSAFLAYTAVWLLL